MTKSKNHAKVPRFLLLFSKYDKFLPYFLDFEEKHESINYEAVCRTTRSCQHKALGAVLTRGGGGVQHFLTYMTKSKNHAKMPIFYCFSLNMKSIHNFF